jgi:mRNA interferase MazF
VTSQVKGYPFEVAIPTGFKLSGVILADQVKSLDWRVRNAEFICKLRPETMSEITGKLATLSLDKTG